MPHLDISPFQWECILVEMQDQGDEPLNQSAFKTFLIGISIIGATRKPGLGLSQTGNPIAAWTVGNDRLTIEFLPNGIAAWVISRGQYTRPSLIRSSDSIPVTRLAESLAPHEPGYWILQPDQHPVDFRIKLPHKELSPCPKSTTEI